MITYGITVCDEVYEFKRLVDGLNPYLISGEKIIVLADQNKTDPEIKSYCEYLNIDFHLFDFKRDFASFKNHLLSLVETDYLFQIDADEQIPPTLLLQLRQNIQANQDLCYIPRVNIVHNITDQDIQNYNWQLNEKGWIQFPDYQPRLIKKRDGLKWEGKVHEQIVGTQGFMTIPHDVKNVELYSILHVKDIEKQRKQNELYDQITV